ncbi:MAG: glycerol-3-phosphate acyltransferase [Eubacteriales bacterium]
MKILSCILIGYLLGSLNPAALLSKLKKKDLRKQGTGNLGATNTMLVLGKGYGALVMIFDIAKALVAVKLAHTLFPTMEVSGVIAGSAAVVGHIYPFYLKFKGGKGLAAFGGLVLGVDPFLFVILLVIAMALMFLLNYSVAMPMSAAVLFPILYGIRNGGFLSVIIVTTVSVLIICKHFSNIGKARRGEDLKIREYVKDHLLPESHTK